MPVCYTIEDRRARKAHRCCECRGSISPGEKYTYLSGVWDGDAMVYKTCGDCSLLRSEIQSDIGELIELGGLYSDMDDPNDLKRAVEIMRKRNSPLLKQFETLLEEEE